MGLKISQMTAAATLGGTEELEVSQLSATVLIVASTINALAVDNSYNDSANGFVTAGFAVNQTVRVSGFTGNAANNIHSGTITALTAGKMTIGGTDGDVIVDDAAGETVTITRIDTRRSALDDIVAYALQTAARVPAQRYTIELANTTDSDPGAGLLKFDNATPASATNLYIDDSTSDGVDLSTFFASLPATGFMKIQSVADAGEWAVFKWTSTTDGTGYWKFAVTIQASKGTLDDSDAVLIDFDSDATGGGGAVATDVIWDAAGDTLYGTGANTGARLPIGTARQKYRVNAGATAPEWVNDAIPFAVACSDETTPLAAGTSKITFHWPMTGTVLEMWAGLTTVQTSGATFTVDVNDSGATMLSTKITIDNTEETSLTAATPPVISDTAITKGNKGTVDIDVIGDGTAKGLKVYFSIVPS